MNRRSFLQTILAASVAPAIVRYDSLMRPVARNAAVLSRVAAGPLSMVELFEESTRIGNGITTYCYFADFDIQLAAGLIDVRRIWADGRELDMKAIEIVNNPDGSATARARRFDVNEFGYRVPNLEFEIETK